MNNKATFLFTDEMNKYDRVIYGLGNESCVVDVYDVLDAYDVTCPAIQHAIKKLLCPGSRGSKGRAQDIQEALSSVVRATVLEQKREMRRHGQKEETSA